MKFLCIFKLNVVVEFKWDNISYENSKIKVLFCLIMQLRTKFYVINMDEKKKHWIWPMAHFQLIWNHIRKSLFKVHKNVRPTQKYDKCFSHNGFKKVSFVFGVTCRTTDSNILNWIFIFRTGLAVYLLHQINKQIFNAEKKCLAIAEIQFTIVCM